MWSHTLLHPIKNREYVQVETTQYHDINICFSCIYLIFFSGQAINYKVSVPSFKQCHDVCVSDQRCCHFSHHSSRNESYPDHSHCFLYSADSCDLTSLVTNEAPSLWRTGRIARCQPQHYNRRQLFGSEFVG